jgi:pilus assembly protein Flp/PilA
MFRLSQRLLQCKKGAALVEYALLVAGVALVGSASVSIFGHKTNDMLATVASILPGAHTDDNGPMVSGKIIETAPGATNADTNPAAIGLDVAGIIAGNGTDRLDSNLGNPTSGGATNQSLLVLEAK